MTNKVDKQKAFEQLEGFYDSLPETVGCMECLNDCFAWCCRVQFPQVVLVEWLYLWKKILETWSLEDIIRLIERTVRSYVSNKITKGCIFWDESTKLCMIHNYRCFSCRTYGIVPVELSNRRYDRLQKRFANSIDVDLRKQCALVSAEDGQEVTEADINKWWDKLMEIETLSGGETTLVHDGTDGTYRAYHDHLLLSIMPTELLYALTTVRFEKDAEKKEICVKRFIHTLTERISVAIVSTLNPKGDDG